MKQLIFSLSWFAALAVGAPAQQATAGTFGSGCGHPQDPYGTTLSYVGLPRLGGTFTVAYQAPTWNVGQISVWAYLFMGASNANMGGVPLPIAPWYTIGGPIGAPHCMIWTSSEWYTAFTTGYPRGQVQITVPLDPRLVGIRLYQQWMIEWRLCFGNSCDGRLYFSNGGVLTMGY